MNLLVILSFIAVVAVLMFFVFLEGDLPEDF